MYSSQEIQFIMAFNQPTQIKRIKYENINNYNFTRGFNEKITKNTPVIHPYFDIDHLESQNEFEEFMIYCDQAKSVLGNYSVGGYTNDEEISNALGLKFNDGAEKVISFHVVYYESRITPAEMLQFINENKNKLHSAIDFDVYKLGSSQLFRHCLSDKHIKYKEVIKHTAGTILDNLKPDTQIITARGDEKIISVDDMKNAFSIHESNINDLVKEMTMFSDEFEFEEDEEIEEKPKRKKQKDINKITINNVAFNDELIK